MVTTAAAARHSGESYRVPFSGDFEDASSAWLTLTPGVAADRKLFTLAGWFNRESVGLSATIIRMLAYAETAGNYPTFEVGFTSGADTFEVRSRSSSVAFNFQLVTTATFGADAWVPWCFVHDSDHPTAGERQRLYIAKQRVTAFSTASYSSLSFAGAWNNATQHAIGGRYTGDYFDGKMAEVHNIPGLAVDPGAFVENRNGILVPRLYRGPFGAGGYRLRFRDATALGADDSGQGNTFTNSNVAQAAVGPP